MKNVLLVGESWVSAATHYKGFDQFGSVTFHLGAEPLVKALEGSDFALTYMPAHEAAESFPFEMEGLDRLRRDHPFGHRLQHPAAAARRLAAVADRAEPAEADPRLGGERRRPADVRRLLQLPGHRRPGPLAPDRRSRRCCPSPACPATTGSRCPRAASPTSSKPDHPVLAGMGGRLAAAPRRQRGRAQAGADVLARLPEDQGGHPLLVARRPRRRPHRGLDQRHRPALAVAGLLRLGGLRPAVEEPARLAHGAAMIRGQLLSRRQRRESTGPRDRERRRPRACPQRRCVEPASPAAPHGRAPRQKGVAGARGDRPPAPAPPDRLRRRARRPAAPAGALRQHHLGPRGSARSASGSTPPAKASASLSIDDEHIHLREERRVSKIDRRGVHRHRHARARAAADRRPRGRLARGFPAAAADRPAAAAGQRRSHRGRVERLGRRSAW